jgi:putative hydrolase of the HAD superfamily
MKFKVLSFDYWDTLVPIDAEKVKEMRKKRAHYLSEIFRRWGYDKDANLIKYISHEIWEVYRGYEETIEITLDKIVEGVLNSLKIEHDQQRIKEVVRIYEDFLIQTGFSLSDNVYEFLEMTKSKGKKIIVISNTPGGRVEREILKRNNIYDFFDAFYFSSEVGIRKPHPAIFEKALNDLQISKKEFIHIGDRPELDVLGAKRAGVLSAHYNPKGYKYLENYPEPDFTIKDFFELEKFL